jgi:hypothetical protein
MLVKAWWPREMRVITFEQQRMPVLIAAGMYGAWLAVAALVWFGTAPLPHGLLAVEALAGLSTAVAVAGYAFLGQRSQLTQPSASDVSMRPGRLTANMTANIVNEDGRWRTSADSQRLDPIESKRPRTLVDARSAVFKTVCGALLRRPGWVRFPSIPATFGRSDSQADSHSSRRQRLSSTRVVAVTASTRCDLS